jgi:hemoglobin
MPEEKTSLYERLGGVFAIAAVVDRFSDAVIDNPVVGKGSKNPALREWSTQHADRLPGLKFMRTLWVCAAAGGPQKYTPVRPGKDSLGLEEAHRKLKISPEEFDEVAAELERALTFAKVPEPEKKEVLKAFAAHKDEVTEGYTDDAADSLLDKKLPHR